MATYIKDLKEDNGDITRPVTEAGAVLLSGGGDLETELTKYVTAENIATTSALTPPVQTNMIADGAVTNAKIANSSITTPKILNHSITDDKMNWTTVTSSSLESVAPEDLTSLITPVSNSWTSRNDIKLLRFGNVLVLRFYQWWVASIAANSACTLGTIDVSVLGAMAPLCGSIEVINGDNGAIMNHGFIYINTEGGIRAYCPSARNGATSMRGSLVWIYA